ncbi:hypothetical protein [Lysinibacillus endophyticus]|uniref:hypothetical protein n=1 Tax=Ureibacillus endophyticus TaxID=1978490 RepID=UPI0031365D2C
MQQEEWMIDGKVFIPKIKTLQQKPLFKDSHKRITTYVENNLHLIIQMLLEHGQIESITSFINDSIKYYLMHEMNGFKNNNY